jgi:hypothetical protein
MDIKELVNITEIIRRLAELEAKTLPFWLAKHNMEIAMDKLEERVKQLEGLAYVTQCPSVNQIEPIDCIKNCPEKPKSGEQPDGTVTEEWKCPHCGKDEGTWFDRTLDGNGDMCTRCNSCGMDVDEPKREPSGEKKWKPSVKDVEVSYKCENTDEYGVNVIRLFRTRELAESFLSKIKALREEM